MTISNLVLPIVALTLVAGYFVLPFVLFKSEGKGERYSFLRYFPIEMAGEGNLKKRTFFTVYSFMTVTALAFSYALTFMNFRAPLFISAMVCFLASSVALFFNCSYSLENYRGHIYSAAALYIFLVGGELMLGAMYFALQGRTFDYSPALMIVSLVLGLLLLLAIFSPKLKKWAYLEKSEENGKTIYVRPKVSPLGLLEWLCILMHGINMILFVINYFLVG